MTAPPGDEASAGPGDAGPRVFWGNLTDSGGPLLNPPSALPRWALLVALLVPSVLDAQFEPPSTGGIVAQVQALRRLGHAKRVLVIGAHPDDEDTELLALLTRGEGAEAAYLSLNRGEGGQNLLGPELGEALGVLRTEELLAARRLDGAGQFFTRAYDFGYSKSLDDTWAHWPRDTLLADVVRVVRAFRPQVIVSVFAGAPRDGHGQHQAAGWLAREAFRVAGDPAAFPAQQRDGLAPWSPAKLYRSTRFDTAATTLVLEGGSLDPAIGRTHHQVAMASRSLHRSQDMGQLQAIGPSPVRLQLLEDRTGRGRTGFFAGVDTALGAPWSDYVRDLDRLRRDGAMPSYGALRALGARLARVEAPGADAAVLDTQRRWLGAAVRSASGLLVDARVADGQVARGESVEVTLEAHNASDEPRAFQVTVGVAGMAPSRSERFVLAAGARERRPVEVAVPDDAPLTVVPTWRASPAADLYQADGWLGRRADDDVASGLVAGLAFDDIPVVGTLEWPVSVRRNEQSLGEVRGPVLIVPRVEVAIDPVEAPWPRGDARPRTYRVTLLHGARDTTRGAVRLVLPEGWAGVPPQPFQLAGERDRQVLTFAVRGTLGPGEEGVLRAVVTDVAGRGYESGRVEVAYPHVRPRSLQRPAIARVVGVDLRRPARTRIAYVRGAADLVPEALAAAGIAVDVIGGDAVARGEVRNYQALVIGPRAYETDPALAAANPVLLEWVRTGGLVLVQYQQYGWFAAGLAPHPLFVRARPFGGGGADLLVGHGVRLAGSTALLGGHDRVTDERAPVQVLRPDHAALRSPNRLEASDWDGWVQERGLYFARQWGDAWTSLIETHDPGEGPLAGGLLVSRLGRGIFVYTGLSFFRQLPAGVPGAYRLFANLLSLE